MLSYMSECPKCEGVGFIAEFVLVNDGHCFKCNGTGQSKRSTLRIRVENDAVFGWDKN
jgi:DnaJ-class molecular chaperone